jgi:hypothetical protein
MSAVYIIAALLVIGDVLLNVARTGKPREPLSGDMAALIVLQYGGIAFLLFYAGVR